MEVLLLWLASADGQIDVVEAMAIDSGLDRPRTQSSVLELVERSPRPSLHDLLDAVQWLRPRMTTASKVQFLRLAVAIALSDGRLSTGESEILRFFTDALDISISRLQLAFKEYTGTSMPNRSDLSDPRWWEERERIAGERARARTGEGRRREQQHQHASDDSADGGEDQSSGSSSFRSQYEADLFVLGLHPGATRDEIRAAHRRLAKKHHPDVYVSLGPDAVAAATVVFERVQAAYERLTL
jgi:DnaJ-domain-containing protein 1